MTLKVGLTGSIGMGKSTTASLFAELGCDTWDADAAVHRLYALGGAAVDPIQNIYPEAFGSGAISRAKLREIIDRDPDALRTIEAIVHPLVASDRRSFAEQSDADIVVFDIPLLFETGSSREMNATVSVTAPPEIQRRRVLDRGTMTEDQFNAIVARQMSDKQKRALADYVIETDTIEHARRQVQNVVDELKRKV